MSLLRAGGHEVLYVIERTRSLEDTEIIQAALEARAIILTQDSDFWRHIVLEKRPSFGAVWLRLGTMPRPLRAGRLMAVVEAHGATLLHCFTTILPDRIEQEPLD